MSRSNLSRKALVSADAECGLSHTGLPLKRKFRPRCCAKTRVGAPCIMRVVPGKRRCRFHGGMSTGPKTKAGREPQHGNDNRGSLNSAHIDAWRWMSRPQHQKLNLLHGVKSF